MILRHKTLLLSSTITSSSWTKITKCGGITETLQLVMESTVLPEGKTPGASAVLTGKQDEATGIGVVVATWHFNCTRTQCSTESIWKLLSYYLCRILQTSVISESQIQRCLSSHSWLPSIPMKLSTHRQFMPSKAPTVNVASKLYEWICVLISMLTELSGILWAPGPLAKHV